MLPPCPGPARGPSGPGAGTAPPEPSALPQMAQEGTRGSVHSLDVIDVTRVWVPTAETEVSSEKQTLNF